MTLLATVALTTVALAALTMLVRTPAVKRAWAVFLSLFVGFLKEHRTLAGLLGVGFERSDVWESTRADTALGLPAVGGIFKRLIGIGPHFGDDEYIRALKARQRKMVRELDMVEPLRKLAGRTMTVAELETHLLAVWLDEIVGAYGLEEPSDREAFLRGMATVRTLIDKIAATPLSAVFDAISRWHELTPVRTYLSSIGDIDGALLLAPFLTTIDTTLLNLVVAPPADGHASFHQLFALSPVKMAPMISKSRGLVIVDIVPNQMDSPGNTAFGPKGVVCPGNLVTSAILKEVQRIQALLSFELAPGSPKPVLIGDIVQNIGNRADVIIEIKERIEK